MVKVKGFFLPARSLPLASLVSPLTPPQSKQGGTSLFTSQANHFPLFPRVKPAMPLGVSVCRIREHALEMCGSTYYSVLELTLVPLACR